MLLNQGRDLKLLLVEFQQGVHRCDGISVGILIEPKNDRLGGEAWARF